MATYETPRTLFFTPHDLTNAYGKYDPNVFKRWVQQGRAKKLRNGLYLSDPSFIRSEIDMFAVANHLHAPSYVSLHSALSYYSLIPEYVFEVTSITTRKTKAFQVDDVRYRYRTIKPSLFFGYEKVQWRGRTYNIATREKAILDLAYLEPQFSDPDWLLGMRFDEDELAGGLNWERMWKYGLAMNSQTIMNRITLLYDTYDIKSSY